MNIGFNPNKQAFGCSECKQGKYISKVMHDARGLKKPEIKQFLDSFAPTPKITKELSAKEQETATKDHDTKILKFSQQMIADISKADEMIRSNNTTIR